jgi:hypothetical protein
VYPALTRNQIEDMALTTKARLIHKRSWLPAGCI